MDQATLKFLRELLPIDDQEIRITSDGAIIRIAWCAIGVNLGRIPTTEAWLDRATIEQASKFFRSYEVRTNATSLPKWIVAKPILLWDTDDGPVLLDGRQRAAQLFGEGHEKVRALIVKKEGRKVDLEGFAGLGRAKGKIKKQMAAIVNEPLLMSQPDLRYHQITAAVLEYARPRKGAATRGQGNQPQPWQWHELRNYLILSVYMTWVAKEFLFATRGCKRESLDDVNTRLLKVHPIDTRDIENSRTAAVKAIIGSKTNASLYRAKTEERLARFTTNQIDEHLKEIAELILLAQRAMTIIERHDSTCRQLFRVPQGRNGPYTPDHVVEVALRDVSDNYTKYMNLDERFRLARFTGVNITPFCLDPPWVRIIGYWWFYVYCLETNQKRQVPPHAVCDMFLQRLAMREIKEQDDWTPYWEELFEALKCLKKLASVEDQCWTITQYKCS
jgi:hypothetical protein